MTHRPRPFAWLLAPALLAAASAGIAADLKLDTPQENLAAARRIQCSTRDGEAVTWYWKGQAYSRVPGEPDRQLFAVEGMNIRQCGPLNGATDGSFMMATREVLLYEDPKTGKVLDSWDNPWTGKQVKVVHVANDPVNQRIGATDRAGRPTRLPLEINGKQWWMTSTIPLFYRNPLAGDYQDYIGGKYHATEMFNFFGSVPELADTRRTSVNVSVGWVRMSSWLPWMEMGDRAGLIYFSTAGRKLDRWEEMPEAFRNEIKANYPLYLAPPPLDDPRPNETSWSYFKKVTPVGK